MRSWVKRSILTLSLVVSLIFSYVGRTEAAFLNPSVPPTTYTGFYIYYVLNQINAPVNVGQLLLVHSVGSATGSAPANTMPTHLHPTLRTDPIARGDLEMVTLYPSQTLQSASLTVPSGFPTQIAFGGQILQYASTIPFYRSGTTWIANWPIPWTQTSPANGTYTYQIKAVTTAGSTLQRTGTLTIAGTSTFYESLRYLQR